MSTLEEFVAGVEARQTSVVGRAEQRLTELIFCSTTV